MGVVRLQAARDALVEVHILEQVWVVVDVGDGVIVVNIHDDLLLVVLLDGRLLGHNSNALPRLRPLVVHVALRYQDPGIVLHVPVLVIVNSLLIQDLPGLKRPNTSTGGIGL